MQHFVIGAGATFAEARELGISPENAPPLIKDFAQKTWQDYIPYAALATYLIEELNYQHFDRDLREIFFELEAQGETNVERFMEYVWINRGREWRHNPLNFPDELMVGMSENFWEDFLYHGIGNALNTMLLTCFYDRGWKKLTLNQTVGAHLNSGDLVLNLNYDTIFELALEQINKKFVYSPNVSSEQEILICKPHGSLNMAYEENSFAFGQPSWMGIPQPAGKKSFLGLMPPRLNKEYAQHPVSQMIIKPILNRQPQKVVMWGVGLTESDADLISLYKKWSLSAETFEIINPDKMIVDKVRKIVSCDICYFSSVSEWATS